MKTDADPVMNGQLTVSARYIRGAGIFTGRGQCEKPLEPIKRGRCVATRVPRRVRLRYTGRIMPEQSRAEPSRVAPASQLAVSPA